MLFKALLTATCLVFATLLGLLSAALVLPRAWSAATVSAFVQQAPDERTTWHSYLLVGRRLLVHSAETPPYIVDSLPHPQDVQFTFRLGYSQLYLPLPDGTRQPLLQNANPTERRSNLFPSRSSDGAWVSLAELQPDGNLQPLLLELANQQVHYLPLLANFRGVQAPRWVSILPRHLPSDSVLLILWAVFWGAVVGLRRRRVPPVPPTPL